MAVALAAVGEAARRGQCLVEQGKPARRGERIVGGDQPDCRTDVRRKLGRARLVDLGIICGQQEFEIRRRLKQNLPRDSHRSVRSEEHTSELQSLMRNSYAVFCLKKT